MKPSKHIEENKIIVEKNTDEKKLSLRLKKIVGVVMLPNDFDEKKELYNCFEKKHLSK